MRIVGMTTFGLFLATGWGAAQMLPNPEDTVGEVRSVELAGVVEHAVQHGATAELARIRYVVGTQDAAESVAPVRPQVSLAGTAVRSRNEFGFAQICIDRWDLCWPPDGAFEETVQVEDLSATLSVRAGVFPTPTVRSLRALSDAQSVGAAAERDDAYAALVVQVIDLYYAVLKAEWGARLAALAEAEAELAWGEAVAKEAQGTVSRVELLEAEARRYAAREQAVRADAALTGVRIALNQVAGYALDTYLVLERPQVPGDLPALEEAAAAADRRPDVARAEAGIAMARAQATLARAQSGPQVRLFGMVQGPETEGMLAVDRLGFVQLSVTGSRQLIEDERLIQERDAWSMGIDFEWTLGDGGAKRAGVQKAESATRAAEIEHALLLQGLEGELRRTRAQVEAGSRALEAARAGLRAMQSAKEAVDEMFERGAAMRRDVLQAELGVAQAELGVIEAEHAFRAAHAAYLRAAGLLVSDWDELSTGK